MPDPGATSQAQPRSRVTVQLAAPARPEVEVVVGVDPMSTVLTCVLEVLGPLRGRLAPGVEATGQRAAAGLNLAPLRPLLARSVVESGLPTVLDSPRSVGRTTIDEQLEMLMDTPADEILRELADYADDPVYRPWLQAPRRELHRYGSALRQFERQVVGAIMPQVQQRLIRSAEEIRGLLGAHGHAPVLGGLHPRVDYHAGQVSWGLMNAEVDDVEVYRLLLCPMVSSRATVSSDAKLDVRGDDGHSTTTATRFLAFAPPGLVPTMGWSEQVPAGDPLSQLLGPSRAMILRELQAGDATTTQLSERLQLAPSTTSHHLKALSACRLVTAERRAGEVRYGLTEAGERVPGLWS